MATASSGDFQQRANSACSFTMDKEDFNNLFDNPPIFDVPPMKFGNPLSSKDAWSKIAHDILSPFNEYQYYIKQQEKFKENEEKFQNLSFLQRKEQNQRRLGNSLHRKKFAKLKQEIVTLRTHTGARLSFISKKLHKLNYRGQRPSAVTFRGSFLENYPNSLGLSPKRRVSMMSLTTKLDSLKSPRNHATLDPESPSKSHPILEVPTPKEMPPSRNSVLKKARTQPKSNFLHQINSMLEGLKPREHSRPSSPMLQNGQRKEAERRERLGFKMNVNKLKQKYTEPFLAKVEEGEIFKNKIKNASIEKSISPQRKVSEKRIRSQEQEMQQRGVFQTPPSKTLPLSFRNRIASKKARQSEILEDELNRRYTPLTLSKMSIKATYELNSTTHSPSHFKEFRIRAVKSAGKLSRAKPKINKYVLRNLIKFKDPEVFPEKYQLEKGKSQRRVQHRPKLNMKKIAEVHMTKMKSFLENEEQPLPQNDTLIFYQHTPSQYSAEGTSCELSRNNSIGMVPLSPTLLLNGSERFINESKSPQSTMGEKRVWLSKFSQNTKQILNAEISKCLLHRRKADWSPARLK